MNEAETNNRRLMRNNRYNHEERKHVWKQSLALSGEKLSFLDGRRLGEVDIRIENNATIRKVRRIMEKRICQNYWLTHSGGRGNGDRQLMRQRMTGTMKKIYGLVPEGFWYRT